MFPQDVATQLPNETWRYVFLFFEGTVAQEPIDWSSEGVRHPPELTSLSLVCRRFYCLARDLLYRTILLSVGVRDFDEAKFAIVHTLAANTRMGSITRAVELGRYSSWLDDNLDPSLEEVIDSLHIPRAFKAHLKKEPNCLGRYGPAIPFLILALTPKVKLVHCSYDLERDITVPWILGGHLDRETAGTPRKAIANYLVDLEEVRLAGSNGFDTINGIELVLLHPNIKTLHISNFVCTKIAIDRMVFSDRPCSLQKLVLRDCAVDAPFVQHILSRCKDLHSLEIYATCWCQHTRNPGHVEMNMDQYGQTLRKFGQNLVRFNLDTSGLVSSHGIRGKIGSLRQLQHLRHLSIAKPQLADEDETRYTMPLTETLPLPLETLHFYLASDYYSTPENPNLFSEDNEEIFKVVSSGQFINLHKVSFIRLGIPGHDVFTKVIGGWDIQNNGGWDMAEEEVEIYERVLTEMELVMNRVVQ
ncbi:hypothetical protein FSARC_12734 [Fusarium sarcochroum]|uniref:F-box domain-containing protein n=1 Tax=Fusarium sarcochroum TaxID=1208366 RepID=A0A8H4T642_9HYPO|nr:hypothetical protein FSARC_12734 [Fusarium sarcochroum]